MDDQVGEVEKTRVSVTLTRPYLDALDQLVDEGIYLSKVLNMLLKRDALRIIELLATEGGLCGLAAGQGLLHRGVPPLGP